MVPLSPARLRFPFPSSLPLAIMMVIQGSLPSLVSETSLHSRSFRKSNELPGELVDGPKHPADLGGSTISGSRRGRLVRLNSELLGILTETTGIVHTSPGYRGLRAPLFQRRLALVCSPLQRSLFWTDSWKQGLCPTFREHGCLTQPPRACEQVDRPTPSTILAPFSH